MKIKKCRRNKKQNIRFRRQNKKKKKMNDKEKKYKNARETLKIIKKIIDYNKDAQNFFHHASKVDKTKSKSKFEGKYCREGKKNEKDNLSETPKQKDFNDFLEKIKEEQKNIDIISFKNVFNYETPDKMLKYLHSLETTNDYNQAVSSVEESFADFEGKVKIMSKGDKKKQGKKILNIVNNILDFALNE